MTAHEALRTTFQALESAGVPHMLTGGFVTNLYAVPRFTKDADIVIQMEREPFDAFARALPPELRLDPQISFETITGSRRHILDVVGTDFRIELFLLGGDEHHQQRFARRLHRHLTEIGCETWVATAEDMLIQKARWFREKDREDMKNIIAIQAEALDWPYIESWCDRHGTRVRLEQIRASIPPLPPL